MGRQKQWVVKLSDDERQQLTDMTRKGVHSARVMTRARLLLLSEQGLLDQEVAQRQGVNAATVASIRKKYAEGGLQAALYEKERPKQPPKLDPQQTAILIAEVCSTPEGREKWTMQLLADRLVTLGVVDSISDETVRRTPEKNALKPWQVQSWCVAQVGADFVWRMEAVLDTYAQPYDASRPVICFDEKSYQLLDHVREPLPPVPGIPARVDHEYKRCGTVNFFVAFEPLTGQRTVTVTERRGNAEFAAQLQSLEVHYPEAEKITLVLDQLSTHSPAALYQHLPAEEARQLTRRFEWVHTPKHASWLNMAELEWSALQRQCLGQRLASKEAVEREIHAWETDRNARAVRVNWQFSTPAAREKLGRHYPA
ncbi:IS630 family transposase [Deinococcus puniceus]|nr:IS630 family transposase [Deinococcus puniceus]